MSPRDVALPKRPSMICAYGSIFLKPTRMTTAGSFMLRLPSTSSAQWSLYAWRGRSDSTQLGLPCCPQAAGWLCAIRDYTLDPPSHVSSAAKRVDSINHTDGSSSTTRRRRRTGSLDPEAAAASITPDESGKIMKRVNSFGRRRGAADEASRAAQSSISTAPSPTSKGGNDASGSTNSNGAGLTLRERRARSASNVGAAVSGISSRHSLSLRASREPHSALAMLERKYEGVEMRTGAAGGQGGSEGNLQVQELDEGATDAMVALAEAWLEERSLSLADDAARAALRAHCSFFSSETEIHDLLGEAYMMQVRHLDAVRGVGPRALLERPRETKKWGYHERVN